MGTSKGYEAPSSPQWGKMKGDVTRQSKGGSVSPNKAYQLLRTFVRTSLGYGGGQRGNGGSGGGGGGGGQHGQSAIATGGRLAGFAAAVANRGADDALHKAGLAEWVGKSAQEVILALVDYLAAKGGTFDEVDARSAIDDLAEELLGTAETYDQVKMVLEETMQLAKIGSLMFRFFSYYLFRMFCRTFYEHISPKRGESKTEGYMNNIKEVVKSALEFFTFGKDPARIDWAGAEGKTISEEVFNQTLQIFGD